MSQLPRALALVAALASAALAAGPLHAAQVRVAVAANMAGPIERIVEDFARATGHEAVVALGSTGRFYAQMRGGAPFEVLLAADDQTPARLEREGLAVPGSRFAYALGRLVLWSADPNGVDAQGSVLKQPPRGKLALADPRFAPYGAAAMQTLTRMGVLTAWQPHLVQGESIGQTFQFVASGNAALGFVALAQVIVDGRIAKGSAWVVPQEMHAPLRQEAVLLNAGRSNPAAAALLQFLKGDAARSTLRAFGYEAERP